jgi:hypothetical protein
LDLENTLVVEIQKGILLYSCHIVRKFLNIDTEHKTQKSQNAVMNQVGNSKFPPIGHLIFFFLPTYAMKITPAKFKNGQERVIVPR